MAGLDYKRAFEQGDFRGYFRWSQKLTSRLGDQLYHACHEDELKTILDEGELGLQSKWSLKLPNHGKCSAPGTWVGLNYFNNGNYYGPFLLSFPLKVLNGRNFMVFRRQSGDRKRYFFVQYEARIPVYSFEKNLWRVVRPGSYFNNDDGKLAKKPGAIYDIVITQPMTLEHVSIKAVGHPKCISGKCTGTRIVQSRKRLAKIAVGEFRYWLSDNEEYKKLYKRFSILDGEKIELFDPEWIGFDI
ncbi:hypothetical protein KAR91_12910 [Candidatus Pacearchaeota archaeon]|nr:hypothetical protein [Candidatus Pacearchaeota archaeon]